MKLLTGVTITIPPDASVFILDDDERRIAWFKEQLEGVRQVTVTRDAEDAIQVLANIPPPDVLFLDHDLGLCSGGYNELAPTGRVVSKHLATTICTGMVVVHSWNSEGATGMVNDLNGAVAVPFGQFKIAIKENN